jgi:hypothetical protein
MGVLEVAMGEPKRDLLEDSWFELEAPMEKKLVEEPPKKASPDNDNGDEDPLNESWFR